MISFAIDDLQIISGNQPVGGIRIRQPVQGFESPDYRLTQSSNPGRHGGTTSSSLYDFRAIQLEGTITGSTPAEYYQNRRDLLAAVAIRTDSDGNPIPHRITFTTLDGQSYYLDVVFKKPLMGIEYPMWNDFMISGTVDKAMIFGSTEVTSGMISPPSGGGYVVPMIVPYISAAATGGSVTLNNPGTEDAWPEDNGDGTGGIRLTGPLTTPVVTNTTTGSYIQLNYAIATGDVVIIDMFNQTITLNGASLIATKTLASDWWSLPPGNNNITLTTTSSSDDGSLTVGFNPPYTGV